MKRRTFIQLAGLWSLGLTLSSKVDSSILNSIDPSGNAIVTSRMPTNIIGVGQLGAIMTSHLRNIDVDSKAINLDKQIVGIKYDSTAKDKIQAFFRLHPEHISSMLDGVQSLILLAGMGGLIGTITTPIIAHAAKERGIPTVALVSIPAKFEGIRRIRAAKNGLADLYLSTGNLIILDYEKLLKSLGDETTFDHLIGEGHAMLAGMARHIVGNIKNQKLANSTDDKKMSLDLAVKTAMALDSEDQRSVMSIYQPDLIRPILS